MGRIEYKQMNILLPTKFREQPLEWLDIDYLPNSESNRMEIHLTKHEVMTSDLLLMFNRLFYNQSDDLLIYNINWWAFCVDTWDINSDLYLIDAERLTNETHNYLELLRKSNIEIDFSGCCKCSDWDFFLRIILDCLLTNTAPYSPFFIDLEHQFAFYFHHTGSIGLYYKYKSQVVCDIISKAAIFYEVKHFN